MPFRSGACFVCSGLVGWLVGCTIQITFVFVCNKVVQIENFQQFNMIYNQYVRESKLIHANIAIPIFLYCSHFPYLKLCFHSVQKYASVKELFSPMSLVYTLMHICGTKNEDVNVECTLSYIKKVVTTTHIISIRITSKRWTLDGVYAVIGGMLAYWSISIILWGSKIFDDRHVHPSIHPPQMVNANLSYSSISACDCRW